MALSSTGAVSFAPVVNVHETSKYWLSDIICESTQKEYARNTFVWAIEILNGDLYCWSVPFLCDFHSEVRRKCLSKKRIGVQLPISPALACVMITNVILKKLPRYSSILLANSKLTRAKGLEAPMLVCKPNSREKQSGLMLGVVSLVGNSFDWLQQASAAYPNEIGLGHVPGSKFGCILSAGQSSRQLHRTIPGDFDTNAFSRDFLDYEIYCPGDFTMCTPSFVPSLYTLYLEAAYLKTQLPVMQEARGESSSEVLIDENDRLTVSSSLLPFTTSSFPCFWEFLTGAQCASPSKNTYVTD